MEAETRKRFIQKAKSIYYSFRCLVCFFVPNDVLETVNEPVYHGGELSLPRRSSAVQSSVTCDWFPFEFLPEDCQRRIFGYLTPLERGHMSVVCKSWRSLLLNASFWTNVDLTVIPLQCYCEHHGTSTLSSHVCYDVYRHRVQKYVAHLRRVRPNVQRLNFAFDISECADEWLELLRGLLTSVRCLDLVSAHLNWKETPVKLLTTSECTVATWSSRGYNDFMSRHRRRQRLFISFFEFFTTRAANVVELVMPFDWSPRSLHALSRLTHLESLSLETYFIPQPVDQSAVDQLLLAVPRLRKLVMAVCVTSGPGLITYSICATRLEHLDVSQCHGFCLGLVDTPRLAMLRMSLQPSRGPLGDVLSAYDMRVPCLYDVLSRGAPRLSALNGHLLQANWASVCYDELYVILKEICACHQHRHVL